MNYQGFTAQEVFRLGRLLGQMTEAEQAALGQLLMGMPQTYRLTPVQEWRLRRRLNHTPERVEPVAEMGYRR